MNTDEINKLKSLLTKDGFACEICERGKHITSYGNYRDINFRTKVESGDIGIIIEELEKLSSKAQANWHEFADIEIRKLKQGLHLYDKRCRQNLGYSYNENVTATFGEDWFVIVLKGEKTSEVLTKIYSYSEFMKKGAKPLLKEIRNWLISNVGDFMELNILVN